MPDEVPMPKLDVKRAEQVAMLIALCTALAFIILVVDWKIKQSILVQAKDVRDNLDRAEKYYWKGGSDDGAVKLSHYASGVGVSDKPATASYNGMGRDAGMEETADPEEDTSNSWAGVRKEESPIAVNTRPRGPIMAVPESDR